MSKNTIPFSKFIDITTTGVSDTFIFNRLNALAVTTPINPDYENSSLNFHKTRNAEVNSPIPYASDGASLLRYIPMPKTITVTSLDEVAKKYGTLREEYAYASEFFSYTSKNATKPQKLTFWNYYPEAQKAALVGAAIDMLNNIKQQGSLALNINGDSYEFDINLENISSFSDAADIINDNLKQPKIDAVPYSLEGTTPALPITAAVTIDASEFVIQDNQSEAIFTYTASITIDTADGVDEIVTKLNTKELSDANLVWSNDGGILKLSQINYSSVTNTIPEKIFVSESDIQMKLGLDNVTTQTGSPEVPALNLGTCEYSTLTNGFIIQGAVASASQTIYYATGDMASVLCLSEKDGGYLVQGSNATSITDLMTEIGLDNGDYYSISVTNNVDIPESDYDAIGTWVSASNGRYCVVGYSNDKRLTSTDNLVYENLFGYDGFIIVYGDYLMAAFVQAAIASVDFSVPNGALNFNFLEASEFEENAIGTSAELDGINANRVNTAYRMGGYGQRAALFGEGKIFGTNFTDIAGYIGNSWIKAKFEIAVANLLISNSLIALRGGGGAALISNSLQDIINTAKSGGIITTVGIGNLLTSEKSAIVTATGNNNAVNLVESQGYYLNTLPINDEDIKLNRIRVQFIYTRNVAVNRVSVQTFIL